MPNNYYPIEQLNQTVSFNAKQQETIRKLMSSNLTASEIWSGKLKKIVPHKERKEIHIAIKEQLMAIQEETCAFCEIKFSYRVGKKSKRSIHREHIAPKSIYRQFTYTPKNFVLACSICNGLDYKADADTISNIEQSYDLCEFSIVHPHLDKKSDYYRLDITTGVLKVVDGKDKGKNTIEMFGLNEQFFCNTRHMSAMCKKYKASSQQELIIKLAASNSHSSI